MINHDSLLCYIKLMRLINNEVQIGIAQATGFDVSLISRFEQGRKTPNDKQANTLLSYYKTDINTFSTKDSHVEELLDQFFLSLYEVDYFDNRELIRCQLHGQLTKNQYFPYYFLLCFCHYVLHGDTNTASQYFNVLKKTIDLFPYDHKVLFFSFCPLYYKDLKQMAEYKEPKINVDLKKISCERTLALYHYSHIIVAPDCIDLFEILEHYYSCRQLLERHQNQARLIMLNIMLANIYSSFNQLEKSIQTDIETLALLKDVDKKRSWRYTVHNNLAFSYLQLQNYLQVINHLDACLPYYKNRLIYFMYGFSHYQLGQKELATLDIQNAWATPPTIPYYDLLVEWLDAMLHKPYQEKCIRLLNKVYTKHNQELDYESSQNILALMVDYYEHIHDFVLAREYKKMIKLDHLIVPIQR